MRARHDVAIRLMCAGAIDVRLHRRMQDERVGGDAVSRSNNYGQRFVLDIDEFCRIRRRRHGFGNDDDGFADESHDIAREQRSLRVGDQRRAGRAQRKVELAGRGNRDHPRRASRDGSVDTCQASTRDRRTHEHDVGLAEAQVVEVAGVASQQRIVLDAADLHARRRPHVSAHLYRPAQNAIIETCLIEVDGTADE